MTRLAFLWRLFDARDRLMLAGLFVGGLVMAGWVGYVTGVESVDFISIARKLGPDASG